MKNAMIHLVKGEILITIRDGFHSRPAGVISDYAENIYKLFKAKLFFQRQTGHKHRINGIMSVALQGYKHGEKLSVYIEGPTSLNQYMLQKISDVFIELSKDGHCLRNGKLSPKYKIKLEEIKKGSNL